MLHNNIDRLMQKRLNSKRLFCIKQSKNSMHARSVVEYKSNFDLIKCTLYLTLLPWNSSRLLGIGR